MATASTAVQKNKNSQQQEDVSKYFQAQNDAHWGHMVQKQDGWHPIIGWRNPEVVHDVLNRSTDEQVRICICCQCRETDLCPHFGSEPFGVCPSFLLDEQNPAETEQRAFQQILQSVQ